MSKQIPIGLLPKLRPDHALRGLVEVVSMIAVRLNELAGGSPPVTEQTLVDAGIVVRDSATGKLKAPSTPPTITLPDQKETA